MPVQMSTFIPPAHAVWIQKTLASVMPIRTRAALRPATAQSR